MLRLSWPPTTGFGRARSVLPRATGSGTPLFARRPVRSNIRSASSTSSEPISSRTRLERINTRLPRFLRRYTTPLFNAPLTHVSSFLILHELTAIIPLFGLAGFFHYTNWLPPFISEWKWIAEGVEKFGNYGRRKGWLAPKDGREIDRVEEDGRWTSRKDRVWNWSEGGTRVVVEFATAWAITKAFLPLRLLLSVWATPWFAAKALTPLLRVFRRKGPAGAAASSAALTSSSRAGGTNAVGGGVAPR